MAEFNLSWLRLGHWGDDETFPEAKKKCQELDMDLLTARNQDELEQIFDYLQLSKLAGYAFLPFFWPS